MKNTKEYPRAKESSAVKSEGKPIEANRRWFGSAQELTAILCAKPQLQSGKSGVCKRFTNPPLRANKPDFAPVSARS